MFLKTLFIIVTCVLNIDFWLYIYVYLVVTNEKLSNAVGCLSLFLTRRALLLATLHTGSSFLLACVLTSIAGGRYTNLIVNCHTDHR